MVESLFPIVFDKCPNCGSTETITKLAWDEQADKGRVDRDTPVAAEHLQLPLLDPKRVIGIVSGILVLSIDWCASCGGRYCTRAEVVDGPVKMGPPPGNTGGPGMMPKGFG